MDRRRLVNKERNRKMGNFTNLLLTFLMLSVVVVTANASFTNRIMDISAELERALNRAMDLPTTNYSELNENVTYIMNVSFDPKGMAGLYNITTWFMNLILPKDIFPDDFELPTNDDGELDTGKLLDLLPSLLKHYSALLALTTIGLLFAILMPLVGLIFCCCRCCGNCGARSQQFDKKHDMCKKVLLATFLIAIATLILFGVVCAFVSNQHLQQGTDELPDDLRHGITDMMTYINHTDAQINILLTLNFAELEETLNTILDRSATIVSDQLKDFANASSFTNLAKFVKGLDTISNDLGYMKNSTNYLRVNASQLSDGLRRVKNELIHSLNSCPDAKCADVKNNVNQLNTTIDFDKLPDVTETIDKLTAIIDNGDLFGEINKGQESFNKIEINIKNSISIIIPQIQKTIKNAGESLNEGSANVSSTLQKVRNMLGNNAGAPINDAEKLLKEYSKYRYYVGIAQSSILLLIILCITFGLMCGICGKRPDGYDDDCCNKGAGSRFLMMGVGIMFLFSLFLMLITLMYFITGMMSQHLICDTLRSPEDNKMLSLVDQMVKINTVVPSNISDIIQDCHRNKSAYTALKLESKLNMSDVEEYLDKFNISEKIDEFKNQVTFNETIEILNEKTIQEINKLKNSGIGNITFSRFTEVLEHNITSIDLNDMANKLLELDSALENGQEMKMSLKQNAMYLQMYQKNLVDPMVETAGELTIRAQRLEEELKLNNSKGFEAALDDVVVEIQLAEEYINGKGKDVLPEIAKDFGDAFISKLKQYLDHVSNKTRTSVGQCGPLSNVYNATLVVTCDKILYPWNGFWVCVGWCLILFIPGIILSVKLATLYQKSESYQGPHVEATPHKKGKKKKHGGDTTMYDTRGGYPEEVSRGADPRSVPHRERDAPGGSSHPDTRYADMAPKHWDDYPNGGPPQYQSAPLATEYERPPPYYYPGPGDRP